MNGFARSGEKGSVRQGYLARPLRARMSFTNDAANSPSAPSSTDSPSTKLHSRARALATRPSNVFTCVALIRSTAGQKPTASLMNRVVRYAAAPFRFTKVAWCTSKIRTAALTRTMTGTTSTEPASLTGGFRAPAGCRTPVAGLPSMPLSSFGGRHGTFGGDAICWACDAGGLGGRPYPFPGEQDRMRETNREITCLCAWGGKVHR